MNADTLNLLESVPGYFNEMGWHYDKIDIETFRTHVQTKTANFVLLVKVTEHWIVFSCNPMIRRPESGWGETTLKHLAAMNHHINLFKFGLDRDEDLFLMAELPVENFSRRQFEETLTTLAHYCSELLVDILQALQIDKLNSATN